MSDVFFDDEIQTWETEEVIRWIENDEGLYNECLGINDFDVEEIFTDFLEYNKSLDIDLGQVYWEYVTYIINETEE